LKAGDLTTQYKEAIDDVMCTTTCPCKQGAANANKIMWEAYTTNTTFPFTYSGMTWTADGFDNWKDCYDANIASASTTTPTS